MDSRLVAALACISLASAAATFAQDAVTKDADANAARSAVEAPVTGTEPDPDAPAVEESAILPSADGHEASQASSMALDCSDGPEACLDPLDGPSDGPTLSTPGGPEATADDGDAVTADP